MSSFEKVQSELVDNPKTWLITGVAGFIGSNLLEKLLQLDQTVVGLDNFSTGHRHNLEDVKGVVAKTQWERFQFHEGDVRSLDACRVVTEGVNYVLHQAALGSVPRSLDDPIRTNENNVSGFLNMLVAARDSRVNSFTFAASSSTYGDHPALPKVEENIGNPLSPYAVTKYVNELYASVFARCYNFPTIGLRYFNVFGPRQDPNGAYAAVIPKWIQLLLQGEVVTINGDGQSSRDFCYVDNAVQANILAAVSDVSSQNEIYNIAVGEQTTLNELFYAIAKEISQHSTTVGIEELEKRCQFNDFRAGDVRHSLADISKAERKLGYLPVIRVQEGIRLTEQWFAQC